jgi:hypothetical protein
MTATPTERTLRRGAILMSAKKKRELNRLGNVNASHPGSR